MNDFRMTLQELTSLLRQRAAHQYSRNLVLVALPLETAHRDARQLAEALGAEYVDFDCELLNQMEADDWEDQVLCAVCRTAIPAERLEVFPNATLCPACQAKDESGELASNDAEYCPRCGGLMKLQKRGGPGLAGYQLVCSECGRR